MIRKFLLALMLLPSLAFGQGYMSGPSVVETIHRDQYTRALDLRFVMSIADPGPPTTLADTAVIDSTKIVLADATNFVDGSYVIIAETGDSFYIGAQLGAASGDTLTLDTPIDRAYPSGSVVLNTTYNMAVDGSTTPKVFQIGSGGSDTEIDITRIMGLIQDNAAMEDTKFGSLDALTNGIVLRVSNGVKTNIWNAKTNADLALLGFDFIYPDKIPAGTYSARFRITYNGQDKHGVTLRLEPGDTLELIVQDDLTDLDLFYMMGQGHLTD